MSIDYIAFGEKTKKIRKALKLTQNDVTFESGISQETLRRIEKGIKPPTITTLEKLSGLYKTDLLFLLANSRTKTDLFSDEIITHANTLLANSDFSTFRASIVEIINDLLENYDEDLLDDNKRNFISYLNSIKDFEFVDARDINGNIQNLKALLFEVSRTRSGLMEDPFYYPFEISILLILSVLLRRNNEIDASLKLLKKLHDKLIQIETPTKREVDFIGTVSLNIAHAYFREKRYTDVVAFITETLNTPKYSYTHVLYCELSFRLATALHRLGDKDAYAIFTYVLKTSSDDRKHRYEKTLKEYYKIDHHLLTNDKKAFSNFILREGF